MGDIGQDCHFFYNSSCIKGSSCPFRHVEEARSSTISCPQWLQGGCLTPKCPNRHPELKPVCYYESQPGGCTRPACQFRHTLPRGTRNVIAAIPGPPLIAIPVTQSHASMPAVWPPRGPPPHLVPGWHGGPPPPHMYSHPSPVPGFRPFLSGRHPVLLPGTPDHRFILDQSGDVHMLQIEPIIINPNEESDLETSPVKASNRTVAPPSMAVLPPFSQQLSSSQPPPQVNNPLDYFLNAKRYVPAGNSASQVFNRLPSPVSRSPLYHRSDSQSPVRRSPRGSLSPSPSRQRSTSMERFDGGVRRRSGSLDRSRSPPWRDRRRFAPRRCSRSPQRSRRSRSADKGRGSGGPQDKLSRNWVGEVREPKLEEVKVTGRKIISIKKSAQQEKSVDEQTKSDGEKKDDVTVSKGPDQADKDEAAKEEVKSLEEIYRERALLSMMEAKRKKILENKRKRWENVSKKMSESEKSDKSGPESQDEKKSQASVDERGDNPEQEVDGSSETGSGDGSDIDFTADVDVEIAEGEIENMGEESGGDELDQAEKSSKPNTKTKGNSSQQVKPSIKSRLGLKSTTARVDKDRKENQSQNAKPVSIKARLGLKPSGDSQPRSGVIKLSKVSNKGSVLSRIGKIGDNQKSRGKIENKNILMVPQITIKNQFVEEEKKKISLKERLGLVDPNDYGSESRKDRKKKRDLDEELMKLIEEEDIDVTYEELQELSKRDKKKLLKKLLQQQGREAEYEEFRKKKKKSIKKKKERSENDESDSQNRRIKIKGDSGRVSEGEEVSVAAAWSDGEEEEELAEEEEVYLEEELEENTEPNEHPTSGSKQESVERVQESEDVKSVSPTLVGDLSGKTLEQLEQMRAEKRARLQEALEPVSLEEIRKQRASKRAQGDDIGAIKISTVKNERKIVLNKEEQRSTENPEPLVRVTFGSVEALQKRTLSRLGTDPYQPQTANNVVKLGQARRERQIYVPPSKKTDEPVKPAVKPKISREIVDYSDMFPKKTTVPSTSTSIKLSRAGAEVETRPPLRLQKGPPKVDVKDATVKTFAEIMAEKKRKRQLAQQASPQKAFRPISLDDDDSNQNTKSGTADRLSPQELPSHGESKISTDQPFTSPVKARNVNKKTPVLTESKLSRWKRHKSNEQQATQSESTSPVIVSEMDASVVPTIVKTSTIIKDTTENLSSNAKTLETPSRTPHVTESEPPTVVSAPAIKRQASEQPVTESVSKEKKAKLSVTLDLDDDLLNLSDDDFQLDENQDHDELMKEIDELLS
ncbi:uncharacterized protein LOC127866930 isoform X2 [Dreissena polymorpha]|uniref:uncharacterized protein LOC127866930 isoform X2 n=1 Tax=Dreissena polymorpha TaxID=45954 RepID=UPI0022640A7A|nr:uncharacterized protein LOC127866930 isoform X2 [Dreissena polymorpha]